MIKDILDEIADVIVIKNKNGNSIPGNRNEDINAATLKKQNSPPHQVQSINMPFGVAKNQLKMLNIGKYITYIARLKEESDRNKARLSHVLEVSEEGLWEWNVQTNQVIHNKTWESMSGIPRSDNSFMEFESAILPEDKERVFQALDMLVKHNHPYNIEFRMKRPDGKVIWVWDRGRVAEYDDEGNPIWVVGIALDITNQKANQQKVANLAYFDQLTGLVNRTQLELKLKQIIETTEPKNSYSAVLFLDLDRFKLLNDSYGHHMGDKLLQVVGQRLNKLAPEGGGVARFGGDEFVIVLPMVDEDQSIAIQRVQRYADNVTKEISKTAYLKSEEQELSIEYAVTASTGGVVFKSGSAFTTGQLLQLADMALYQAKARGGHSAMICDTDMQDELTLASALKRSMRESVANRDFCIHFQPKYNMHEQIIGAEALVRWHHPERGLLAPAAFMEMAEESNLIIPIGAMVLEQACQQLEKWQACQETEHLHLSVNLSAKQIWQRSFVDDFVKVVETHNIDHSKLIVEVTESVLIEDIHDATDKLTQLKQFGVSISLDDFGTGYSSMNYLRYLPIDEIKVDRSFVKNIDSDKQAYCLVKTIVDMANNFNLKVVAEGVENRSHFELLNKDGVQSYQGFYFSKPLPEHELEQLLIKSNAANHPCNLQSIQSQHQQNDALQQIAS